MKKILLFSVIMFTSVTSMAATNYEWGASRQLQDKFSAIDVSGNDEGYMLDTGCYLPPNGGMQVC